LIINFINESSTCYRRRQRRSLTLEISIKVIPAKAGIRIVIKE